MCIYIDQAYFKEDKIILHTLVCNLVIFFNLHYAPPPRLYTQMECFLKNQGCLQPLYITMVHG